MIPGTDDTSATTAAQSWWTEFYTDLYAELELADDTDTSDAVAEFLIGACDLPQGETIFDQCCGTGRLARAFARRGHPVFGNDQAASYIERARAWAQAEQMACEFAVADARVYVPPRPCSLAVNWFTSFGHADDLGNAAMLACLHASLGSGGQLALETINAPWLRKNFRPRIDRRYPRPDGEIMVRRDCELVDNGTIMRQVWRYSLPDGTQKSYSTEVRLYDPETLAGMVRSHGFSVIDFYGDHRGIALTRDTPRCILLARQRNAG